MGEAVRKVLAGADCVGKRGTGRPDRGSIPGTARRRLCEGTLDLYVRDERSETGGKARGGTGHQTPPTRRKAPRDGARRAAWMHSEGEAPSGYMSDSETDNKYHRKPQAPPRISRFNGPIPTICDLLTKKDRHPGVECRSARRTS